ncbi:hypothetical protein HK102_001214 [Quaeritorhiza haematococci]|nr:hypothetical protein HK102_001214 [Quaeritorhiza haematococci]
MTPTEYTRHVNAAITKLTETDKVLMSATDRMWGPIKWGYLNFNQSQLDADNVGRMTREELIEFFDEYVGVGARRRRKLSVMVWSKGARKVWEELEGNGKGEAGEAGKGKEKEEKGEEKIPNGPVEKKTEDVEDSKTSEVDADNANTNTNTDDSAPPDPATEETDTREHLLEVLRRNTVIKEEDVFKVKAGWTLSRAPVPVQDIKEFHDL